MFEFVKKMFRAESSGATARERLRLVLLSDHLALSPEIVASIKADLFTVLSKYVEFDESSCDVSFEQREREVAMLANIPIRSMKARPPSPTPTPPSEPPSPIGDPAPMSAAVADAPEPQTTQTPKPRRRRRRRVTKVAAAPG